MIVATAPAVGPTLKKITAGRRYVKNGRVCRTLRIGLMTVSTHLYFHAAIPSSKPIRNAIGAATTSTDIVCMAMSHCPISAVQTKVPPASAAIFQPPR